jgi:hypothetical protein
MSVFICACLAMCTGICGSRGAFGRGAWDVCCVRAFVRMYAHVYTCVHGFGNGVVGEYERTRGRERKYRRARARNIQPAV